MFTSHLSLLMWPSCTATLYIIINPLLPLALFGACHWTKQGCVQVILKVTAHTATVSLRHYKCMYPMSEASIHKIKKSRTQSVMVQAILLPQSPECWDHEHGLPHPAPASCPHRSSLLPSYMPHFSCLWSWRDTVFCFCCLFKAKSHCVTLAGLELTI